jgi:hypothetical protein
MSDFIESEDWQRRGWPFDPQGAVNHHDAIVASGGTVRPARDLYWSLLAPWEHRDHPDVPDRDAYDRLVAPRLTRALGGLGEARRRLVAAVGVLRHGVDEEEEAW